VEKSIAKTLLKIALPILIGLSVTAWLFCDEFSADSFRDFSWSQRVIVGLALAVLFMIGRDFGLAWRFHTIASPDLSWLRAFKVDLMCAFTSAITPSAVGGSALAIFYLNREGVDLGRATALTLTTLFLDEMFFVVFCPLIIIFMPLDVLFGGTSTSFLEGIQIAFWLVYAGIVAWTLILFLGIIVMPHKVAVGLDKLFSVKLLRRWHAGAVTMGENMVATSRQIKEKPRRWWLNVFGATTMSWFSRYLIVNALFWGFCPEASPLLIFSRQFVVWVILMISPTPGGSGISEWLFTTYYGDLIGSVSIALVLALAWRLISYYIYLAIGVMILPSYFSKRKKAI
jgi:hypothetical protein